MMEPIPFKTLMGKFKKMEIVRAINLHKVNNFLKLKNIKKEKKELMEVFLNNSNLTKVLKTLRRS